MKSNIELRKLDLIGIKEELNKSVKNLFELKMKLSTGELKQTHLVKNLRRYVARLNTIKNELSNS